MWNVIKLNYRHEDLQSSALPTELTFQKYVFYVCNHKRVLAEREGFEPPEPCSSFVFKTNTIDHSVISPINLLFSLLTGIPTQNLHFRRVLLYAVEL